MACACFVRHWTCEGRRGHFAPDWSLSLLCAVVANAEAQQRHCQAWRFWLPVGGGYRLWRVEGGRN